MSGGSSKNRRKAKRAEEALARDKAAIKGRKRIVEPDSRLELRPESRLPPTQPFLSSLRRHFRWWYALVGGVALAFSLITGIYFFLPRVLVSPGVTLRTSNPFTTMFTVHNEGSFSLYSLKFSCRAYKITWENGPEVINTLGDINTFDVPELRANEKTNTPCYVGVSTAHPVQSADIGVILAYRSAWFVPWRSEQRARFVATRDADDVYHWVEMADYRPGEAPTQ